MRKHYHGAAHRGPYFEGWYLKCQTKDAGSLALIPALHIDGSGRRSASLQVIGESESWWLDYPETKFHASERQFEIRLEQNLFSEGGIQLDVERSGLSLQGSVCFGPFTPLRSNIMGPFCFVPGMECSHGVVSLNHSLKGSLCLNGTVMDFSGGVGYIETDRGRSFPSSYLWAQCIWQDGLKCRSLMLSIATIPLPPSRFTGCICAIFHEGTEYRMATYLGARVERWSGGGAVIRQGGYRLAVELLSGNAQPLRAPDKGSMSRTIHESLCCKLRCRFWSGDRLLFDHIGSRASFEYASLQSNV